MATLSVVVAGRPGVDVTGVAAAGGGDAFANTGHEMLVITNGDASSHSVTAHFQKSPDGLTVTDRAVAVAAGKTMIIGPFPTDLYNDTNNLVQLSYTAVTSVKVAVVKVTA